MALCAGGLAALSPPHSDFSQSWNAARFLLSGEDPYALIGPGRPFEWGYPYLYPLPTAVIAIPFVAVPLPVANVAAVTLVFGLLTWALTRHTIRNPQLWLFTSGAFLVAVDLVQWAPALMVAVLLPSCGWLLAAKPTIGAALLVAYPSRRAVLGAAAVTVATTLLWPWWVARWLGMLPAATHMVTLILLPGGPLVLLALLKWRRAEARLLVALACVPHTAMLYEVLPLFLVVRRWWEGLGLSLLTYLVYAGLPRPGTFDDLSLIRAERHLWLLVLPCVAAVLCRPNRREAVANEPVSGPPLRPLTDDDRGTT